MRFGRLRHAAGGLAGGRNPTASTESLRDALYDGAGTAEQLYLFATQLFTHNSGVALLAFALPLEER